MSVGRESKTVALDAETHLRLAKARRQKDDGALESMNEVVSRLLDEGEAKVRGSGRAAKAAT